MEDVLPQAGAGSVEGSRHSCGIMALNRHCDDGIRIGGDSGRSPGLEGSQVGILQWEGTWVPAAGGGSPRRPPASGRSS